MIEQRISVRYFNKNQNLETINWPVDSFDYVEQIIYSILESFGVKPIYKTLFGLRVIDKQVWLAPNLSKRELLALSKQLPGDTKFELRLRFRPSSYGKMLYLDRQAFGLVFNQMRYDFTQTRFYEDAKFLALLDDAVLGLIGLELWRYSIDNDIDTEATLKQVDVKEFIPKQAPKWQRRFFLQVAENLDLRKSVQMGYDICDKDTLKIKQNFIELFLNKVAQDYACEVYNVVQIIGPEETSNMEIRVRYNQTEEESQCLIEVRPSAIKSKKTELVWEKICEIETISRGTLRENVFQLTRSDNFIPLRYEFETVGHAQSFISCVDGYYRMMRKWNFNLCREITSPELEELKQMGCHGPIGYETSRVKLINTRKRGSFLVRKCVDKTNRFLIDTILFKSNSRLIIDVDRLAGKGTFRYADHTVEANINVSVSTEREEYSTLKSLVEHTQIWVEDDDRSYPQQLKHWVYPDESDDYPGLMLSISKRKLVAFEEDIDLNTSNSLNELPRFIPQQMLQLMTTQFDQKEDSHMTVKLAKFNREREVILKTIKDRVQIRHHDIDYLKFHFCPESCKFTSPSQTKSPRLCDWIFIKHHVLAETIGFDTNDAYVQEYFPFGPLDKFLQNNSTISPVFKLSVSVQLAEALLFMQERNIIHGKIRCHNVFVKQQHPILVKLADPLGPFACDRDQAFIPPEYVGATGELCIKRFDSSIDVWALGTTMWQIYSNGISPPANRYANTLLQPLTCPYDVWLLIESCWILNAKARASPQVILRDLNDLFAWEEGVHEYYYIQRQLKNGDTPAGTESNGSPVKGDLSLASDQTNTSQATTITGESSSQRNLIRAPPMFSNRNGTISVRQSKENKSILSTPPTNHSCERKSRYPWKGLVDGLRGGSHNLLSRTRNLSVKQFSSSKIDFSELSMDSCSTPSDSGATRETDVLDFQGILDAVDCCVWHIDSSRLRLGPEIGRGTSGVVIKGALASEDGSDEKVVAVKRIDKNHSSINLYNDFNDLKKEFDVLKQLDHKNIIKILGYVDESYMMLIFEFMPLGSLLAYIKNYHQSNLLTLPLRKYAQDIASGMAYLERHRVVHRDLALRNILVENQDKVKICDFGLARKLDHEDHYSMRTDRALPLKWYAPETLLTWRFTHKSDVWSYGIVLWEIYSGGSSPQYSSGTYAPELAKTLETERLPVPRKCPLKMYELMLKCWAYNPDHRESFSNIERMFDANQAENGPSFAFMFNGGP